MGSFITRKYENAEVSVCVRVEREYTRQRIQRSKYTYVKIR